MEETLKVSIGGVSFMINKDGFNRLDAYLRGIEAHYAGKSGGREIVDDIESRIAELLLERHTREDVVTLDRVEKVISVMGNPSQFDDEQEKGQAGPETQNQAGGSYAGASTPSSPAKAPRRLFRDNSDRLLGGVCSGLAHYFKFDPSILRIALAAILVFNIFARTGWVGWNLFTHSVMPSLSCICFWAYIILWIVVPSAKTYTQRCQMMGADPGVRGAELNFSNPVRPSGWWLGRILKVMLGLFFIFLGLCCLFIAGAFLIKSDLLFGANPVNALNLLELNPWVRILLKVSFLLCVLIPCIAFLYVGIRWLFNIRHSKYRPGLILFLLWVLSLIGFSALVGTSSTVWPGGGSRKLLTRSKAFPKHYDTLYVNYASLPQTVEGQTPRWEKIQDRFRGGKARRAGVQVTWNGRPIDDDSESEGVYTIDSDNPYYGKFYIFVSQGKDLKTAYAVYPQIEIDHKSSTTIVDDTTNMGMSPVIIRDTTIRSEMTVYLGRVSFFDRWKKSAIDEGEATHTLIDVKDSVITLNPTIITRSQKYDGTYLTASLCVPDSCVVIIQTPQLPSD